MTRSVVESLASRVVEAAKPGEAIEAFVSSSRSCTVRAYNAEVESFTSATNLAAGIRVIVDGRQGFAHCGTHDTDSVEAALAAARDNARHVAPDEYVALISPDDVKAPTLDLFSSGVEELDAGGRIDRAIELERRVTGADKRITGVRSANYSDGVGEFALASSSGVAAYDRSSSATMSVSVLASDGESTSTGAGGMRAGDPLISTWSWSPLERSMRRSISWVRANLTRHDSRRCSTPRRRRHSLGSWPRCCARTVCRQGGVRSLIDSLRPLHRIVSTSSMIRPMHVRSGLIISMVRD